MEIKEGKATCAHCGKKIYIKGSAAQGKGEKKALSCPACKETLGFYTSKDKAFVAAKAE